MHGPSFHTVCQTLFLGCSIIVISMSSCTSRTTVSTEAIPASTSEKRSLLNINTADRDQLSSLPGIGPSLAEKIIEHRDRYGPLRKIEHLLLIEGMSKKRFDAIRPMIRAE